MDLPPNHGNGACKIISSKNRAATALVRPRPSLVSESSNYISNSACLASVPTRRDIGNYVPKVIFHSSFPGCGARILSNQIVSVNRPGREALLFVIRRSTPPASTLCVLASVPAHFPGGGLGRSWRMAGDIYNPSAEIVLSTTPRRRTHFRRSTAPRRCSTLRSCGCRSNPLTGIAECRPPLGKHQIPVALFS